MSRPPENQSSSSSSAPRATDPFELWRQIYETNERAWNAVLERTVNNPAFAESSGKILETFLSAQKTVRENMRSYLEQINLPTREDIARLGELIVSLIVELLSGQTRGSTLPPARTRCAVIRSRGAGPPRGRARRLCSGSRPPAGCRSRETTVTRRCEP